MRDVIYRQVFDAFVPCVKYLPGGVGVRVETGFAVEAVEENEQEGESKKGGGNGQDQKLDDD